MREIWKDIDGYDGIYQVSNMGRVRSIDHVVTRQNGITAMYRGRILTPVGRPYLHVSLSQGPRIERHRVHRLVAQLFVPNPNGYTEVDHIDCDKTNNRADNLRWCTHAENMQFAKESGRMSGGRFGWTQESAESYSLKRRKPIVRSDGKWYACRADAAADLGVTCSAISHVLMGLNEHCQGYGFTYA